MKKHNKKQQKDEKRRKKALILWFTLPLSLLLIGGGTVGVLAVTTDLFSPRATKTSLPTIFGASDSWKDNVSTIVTGYSGAGYVANTDATGVHFVSENDVINILKNDSLFNRNPGNNHKDVMNEIDITLPAQAMQNNNSWWQIDVSAKTKSRTYDGSFYFYIYIHDHEQGSLVTDFPNKNIDLSSDTTAVSVDDITLFAAIKSSTSNGNLDTNAIKLQYESSTGSWSDWSWSLTNNRFGTGPNASSDSLLCWSIEDDCYKNIRIAPGGVNPNYYAGTGPVEFTLKLYRPELKSITAYVTDRMYWNDEFVVTPTPNSYLTRFDTIYDQKDWYKDKLDGAYLDTWTFTVGTTAEGGIFNIKGNPFYKTYEVTNFSTADASYKFAWQVEAPVDVVTVIVSGGSAINNLNNVFYETPRTDDVIAALKNRIDATVLSTISWNQIDIAITAPTTNPVNPGIITLTGKPNSLMYSSVADNISYTLRQ